MTAFVRDAVAAGADAVMLLTHGRIVVQHGIVAEPIASASTRKPIFGALIGIASAEGLIDIDRPVADYGFSDLTGAERNATVRQVLEMRSGIYRPAADDSDQMRARRPAAGSHPPGSHFYYNNWDANALARLYWRATGQDAFIGFDQRIAKPICMQDFELARDGRYRFDPAAPDLPSYGFRISARDLARFGQLYLDRGRWGSRQIVPEGWVRLVTTGRSSQGWGGAMDSFAMGWWTPAAPFPANLPAALKGSFTANGAGGQKLTVLPEIDSVVVVRSRVPALPKKGPAFVGNGDWTPLLARLAAARRPANALTR